MMISLARQLPPDRPFQPRAHTSECVVTTQPLTLQR